ncbi:hypothetical protein ABGB16_04075 [Micromonospora sp. B11E3]|uniref:hypothetical protein n=1 Tax=Micromonospora sp. B11E3 TaxID=3153562 RepID=UPI00325EAC6D
MIYTAALAMVVLVVLGLVAVVAVVHLGLVVVVRETCGYIFTPPVEVTDGRATTGTGIQRRAGRLADAGGRPVEAAS